jgi:hypothetical protein
MFFPKRMCVYVYIYIYIYIYMEIVTLYDKIFPGYQRVKWLSGERNQSFKDRLCLRLQDNVVSGESVCVRYRPNRVTR